MDFTPEKIAEMKKFAKQSIKIKQQNEELIRLLESNPKVHYDVTDDSWELRYMDKHSTRIHRYKVKRSIDIKFMPLNCFKWISYNMVYRPCNISAIFNALQQDLF